MCLSHHATFSSYLVTISTTPLAFLLPQIVAQQKRIDHYMRTHTVSGQAILDPTSRLHPHPSEAVLVKPKSFGLGGSSSAVLAKEIQKHPDVRPGASPLLSKKYRWVQI